MADNIQVFSDDSAHDLHQHEAMERTSEESIKLNFDKCIVKSISCSFFGNIFTPQGVKCYPKKDQAIRQMHVPSAE